jgi:hypothetical protein
MKTAKPVKKGKTIKTTKKFEKKNTLSSVAPLTRI